MRILSVYFGHDANCTLLEDGEPVVVLEKERLTRIKHDQGVMDLEGIVDHRVDKILRDAALTDPFRDRAALGLQLAGLVIAVERRAAWIGQCDADLICDVGSFDGTHALRFVRPGRRLVAIEANPRAAASMARDPRLQAAKVDVHNLSLIHI